MRPSIARQALAGAATVSALVLPLQPPSPVDRRAELVDLAPFGSFPTITPEEASSRAEKGLSLLFGSGAFGEEPWSPPSNAEIEDVDAADSSMKATEDVQDDSTTQAAAAGTCDANNPNIRFEWRNYQDTDRAAFVAAIQCLKAAPSAGSPFTASQNRYEDLVSVHQQMTDQIHMVAQFLPWHRYFVWVFEQLMRDECGFDRAFPWWDETLDGGNFAASPLFTDAYFGPATAVTADGQGTCIESGAFANTTLHVGPGTGNSDHCLSRAVNETLSATVSSSFVNDCNSRTTYSDMESCQELGPHAYGHNAIGAVMAEVSSSVGDPIFFMHHLFVDHTFRIWQNADAARLTTINGCADKASPCTAVTMDTVLSSMGLRPDTTVGAVMDTLGGFLCYRYDH
ncbi:Uu.00g143220.m01.CDS01 [Anthostomella pinea]|uniref:Uu.00g143220.m01.CDS01 n=1 Tax=Anthostomella pinea TaxID=933095 RepID=A0AAI8VQK3_9PEZI|nr:Uu.00g143220.m01.CDS01 [Anthostomella pinea]